jgi:hypothetical protein
VLSANETRAQEKGTLATEPARLPDDRNRLIDVFPLPATLLAAVYEPNLRPPTPDADRCDPFAVALPLPKARPAVGKDACFVEAVHVDRTAVLDGRFSAACWPP